MRVVSIDSKMPFKFNRLRAHNRVSEGLIFLAGIVIWWAPSLVYSLVSGQTLLLCLVGFTQALGAVLGVFVYMNQSSDYLSCVPVNHRPDVPNVAAIHEAKKIA
jgi:hypothetical protein